MNWNGKNLAWKVGSGLHVWKSPDALNVWEDTCFSSGFPGKKKRGGGNRGEISKKNDKGCEAIGGTKSLKGLFFAQNFLGKNVNWVGKLK